MKTTAYAGRAGPLLRAGPRLRAGPLLLAGIAVLALTGCENGPDLDRLAPTMPKLTAEVPESAHPESKNGQYPNINNAPDRPSVMHSESELKEIEKSLEADGGAHVKDAVSEITGEPPKKGSKDKGDKAGKKPAAEKSTDTSPGTSDAGSGSKPLSLTPPPDDPS
ncbi:hypothetical protein [Microbaculum sp. FT89]|uniref:hypothetical protein n=1 Tax=Microbaculum sp. FT89 TaxID=3447298 RepID=UPI003F5306B7